MLSSESRLYNAPVYGRGVSHGWPAFLNLSHSPLAGPLAGGWRSDTTLVRLDPRDHDDALLTIPPVVTSL